MIITSFFHYSYPLHFGGDSLRLSSEAFSEDIDKLSMLYPPFALLIDMLAVT
jgi:hypothetical protein